MNQRLLSSNDKKTWHSIIVERQLKVAVLRSDDFTITENRLRELIDNIRGDKLFIIVSM